jgi:hypothetical protein
LETLGWPSSVEVLMADLRTCEQVAANKPRKLAQTPRLKTALDCSLARCAHR